MVNKELLEIILEGALLVNTARGSIIDEDALAVELKKARFRAILDVFETEPLPAGSKLRGLDNVMLVPHMAGPTMDRRKLVTFALLKDIRNHFDGRPLQHEIDMSYALNMTRSV